MSVLAHFSQDVEEGLVRFWPPEARRALARVLFEVYHADGKFSAAERDDFAAFLDRIEAKASEVESLDLAGSIALLEKDPKKRHVAYAWIAHALFADDAWGAAEKSFVDRIIQKYGLAESELRAAIKTAQSRKIEEGMKAILAEIEG